MIGTTEPLESLFGSFKRTKEGVWDGFGGVGRLILSMASHVGEITEEIVKSSLETVTIKNVKEWIRTCQV